MLTPIDKTIFQVQKCAYFSAAWGLAALFVFGEFYVEGVHDPLQALVLPHDAGIYCVIAHGVGYQRQAKFRLPYLDLVD
jgi:hypothetical protein